MRKIQSQGVQHITLVGADRQTSIDHSDVLLEAHKLRVERGDYNDDRAPKDPYRRAVGTSA